MELQDLCIGSMRLVLSYAGVRRIYCDDALYYKVWEPNYIYGKFFESAYLSGYYDQLAEVVELITQNGKCIGYVTEVLGSVTLKMEPRRGGTALTDDNLEDPLFSGLCERILKETVEKKFVYYDLTSSNVKRGADGYCLIDLDSVVPHSAMRDSSYMRSKVVTALMYTPETYRKCVVKIIETEWGL